MKMRKIIVEIICFILLMNWFYEGIYKVAYWSNFSLYMKHAPLLKPVWQVLAYGIPVGEIVLALMFIFPKQRVRALYISIGVSMVFVFWIISVYLFTNRLFWPYHAMWKGPTWMQKMVISLGVCWGAFTVIVLASSAGFVKIFPTESMSKASANIGK